MDGWACDDWGWLELDSFAKSNSNRFPTKFPLSIVTLLLDKSSCPTSKKFFKFRSHSWLVTKSHQSGTQIWTAINSTKPIMFYYHVNLMITWRCVLLIHNDHCSFRAPHGWRSPKWGNPFFFRDEDMTNAIQPPKKIGMYKGDLM